MGEIPDPPDPRPSVPPEEPQDFAEEMRASSWKQWVDAHPAEEPPEFKEALNRFRMWARNVILREGIAVEYGLALDDEAAARAALVAIYERQSEALEMFRDEQQRDKANLLTPEEAHHALDQIPDNQCGWPPKNCPVCDSLREKRRRRADTGVHP